MNDKDKAVLAEVRRTFRERDGWVFVTDDKALADQWQKTQVMNGLLCYVMGGIRNRLLIVEVKLALLPWTDKIETVWIATIPKHKMPLEQAMVIFHLDPKDAQSPKQDVIGALHDERFIPHIAEFLEHDRMPYSVCETN